jgi:signal peptidase II
VFFALHSSGISQTLNDKNDTANYKRRRCYAHAVFVFSLALALDRAAKYLALSRLVPMPDSQSQSFISLGLFFNTGITFSLLKNYSYLSLAAALIGRGFLGFLCVKNQTIRAMPGMVFLWAGAVGNLIDRLVYGYVIDWIYIRVYVGGYINLADIWLCVGSFIVLVQSIKIFRRRFL